MQKLLYDAGTSDHAATSASRASCSARMHISKPLPCRDLSPVISTTTLSERLQRACRSIAGSPLGVGAAAAAACATAHSSSDAPSQTFIPPNVMLSPHASIAGTVCTENTRLAAATQFS